MKRFCWLLALPYVMTFSTGTTHDCYISMEIKTGKYDTLGSCKSGIKPYYEDLAVVLNEAHERRTKEEIPCPPNTQCIDMGNVKDIHWKDSKKAEQQDSTTEYPVRRVVTDKQACGQDDCGADPK